MDGRLVYIVNILLFLLSKFSNSKKEDGGKRQCAEDSRELRAMPSPPETPSSGKTDTPNEATPLAQCSSSRKRKADQEECFPADFVSEGLD